MTAPDRIAPVLGPSAGFDYYRPVIYWNDFEAVVAYTNWTISGRADEHLAAYVRRRYGAGRRAFVPNCGNGWVERGMIAGGLTASAIGTDIVPELLSSAAAAAEAAGLDARYIAMDSNDLDLDGLDFDRIVNFAAFHHIAYLDRALRRMLTAIPEDGLLIGYDYTGAHRNQYPWESWSRVVELNASLPAGHRAELIYPHLPTMIHTDPTEAVHSELILDHVGRYFVFEECVHVGGALAYPILYENAALFADRHSAAGCATLRRVLDADAAYCEAQPHNSLFTFWVARPNKAVLEHTRQLAAWTREEEERERRAAAMGQRYHPPGALELIYDQLAALRADAARGR